MTDYETAPVSLQNGMPAKERNGMYGSEDRLIEMGVGARFEAVVTIEVVDVRASQAKANHYPLVKLHHIEPVWDEFDAQGLANLQKKAKEARGDVELDVPSPVEPNVDFETPLAEKDVAPVVTIGKGSKKP